MDLDAEQYTVQDIKRLFTKHTSINYLNDFTLQDLEDAKKRIYQKFRRDNEEEKLKHFLDRACQKVAEDKFTGGIKQSQGVVVKNTVRDSLNPDYKNTLNRLILIDSQYRPVLNTKTTFTETNFMVSLNEKVVNVVSIAVTNIQIPYTFYNVEERQGNNRFAITVSGTTTTISVPDGNYTMTSLIAAINGLQSSVVFSAPSTTTGKITLTTSTSVTVDFMPIGTKLNTTLGWYLGFRSFTGSSVVDANQPNLLKYTINGTVTGDAVASVPHTKYIVVVVDDFSTNQTTDTMVQTKLDQELVKPTSYYTNDPHLDHLTPDNIDSYLTSLKALNQKPSLTKSQLFTRAQQNLSRLNLYQQNLRQEVHAPNQVLAVFPFDYSITFGDTYFTDKCDYKRDYHGPVNLERLQVKLFDDKGILLNLNSCDWFMTLMTENLYKY